MTRPSVLLLGFTVAVTSVTAGFLVHRRGHPGPAEATAPSASSAVKLPTLKGWGAPSPSATRPALANGGPLTESRGHSTPVGPAATPQALIRQHQSPTARTPAPTRQELEWRAAKVEQEANHEMERLVPLLQLTDAEQDRVFSALVRRSAYYDPSMGSTGGTIVPTGTAAGTSPTTPSPSSSPSTGSSSSPAASPVASTTPARAAAPVPSTPAQTVAVTDPAADLVNPAPLDAVDGVSTEDIVANDPVYAALPEDKKKAYLQQKTEEQDFWKGVMSKVEAQLKYGE